MRAMNTPPTRLLKVAKKISASRPGTAWIACHAPRTSTWPFGSSAWRVGGTSGIWMLSTCANASAVSPIAMTNVHPMPSKPTAKPLNTLVTMKPSPWTEPTKPLALSRSSAGTSRVTVVDRAMLRMLSTTAPTRMTTTNTQNTGPVQSTRRSSGKATNSRPATTNVTKVTRVEPSMIRFLRWRSTSVPNTVPNAAISSMNDPPMIEVASTDRVST